MAFIAIYVRVSTDDQSVERQLRTTKQKAEQIGDELTADSKTDAVIKTYRDKQTGTNTDRDGYQELMHDVKTAGFEAVVVDEVSRIARSISDLEETIEIFEATNTSLHFCQSGLTIDPTDDDPFSRALIQLLGVFSELEARMTRARIRDGIAARQDAGKVIGQPPLGMAAEGGDLVPGDDYDRVADCLQLVDEGEMSKRQAGKELDCARATIRNALERRKMYGLEPRDDDTEVTND